MASLYYCAIVLSQICILSGLLVLKPKLFTRRFSLVLFGEAFLYHGVGFFHRALHILGPLGLREDGFVQGKRHAVPFHETARTG